MEEEKTITEPVKKVLPGSINEINGNEAALPHNQASEPSPREYLVARLRERYPDDDFEDNDIFLSRIREDVDTLNHTLQSHNEKERQLADIFSSDPRSAEFLMNWAKGDDPVLVLLRTYGDDFREALDDPEKLEAFTQARNEYLQRQTKERELRDQAEKNLPLSLEALDKAVNVGGYSDEDADKAFELLNNIVNDAIVEKVSPETWALCLKAISYDRDVEQASYEGEVRGRNTKIDETRKKKTVPDNMPPLLSGSGASTPASRIIGTLDRIQAANGPDIFERGNPVRKTRR